MDDALKKLKNELHATQSALSEANTRLAQQDAKHHALVKDLEDKVETLEQAHHEWESALDAVQYPIFMHDEDFRIMRCNRAYQRCAGIPYNKIIGQLYFEVFPNTHAPLHHCLRMLEEAAEEEEEEVIACGATYRSIAFSISDEQGAYLYSVHILEDITERKQAETTLEESELRFRTVIEQSPIGMAFARDGITVDVNPVYLQMFGYDDIATLRGQPLTDQIAPHCRAEMEDRIWRRIHNEPTAASYETTGLRKDGSQFPLFISAKRIVLSDGPLTYAFLIDFTERKQAESELLRLNRVLKTLTECDRVLVRTSDETELMNSMCQVIISSGGYSLAWIGLVRQDENKSIEAVAIAGEGKGYLEALHLTWGDNPRGRAPAGTAVRTGRMQVAQDIKNDLRFDLWREAIQKYGHASNIALPLKGNGIVFGVLSIYAAEASVFSDSEIELLERMANDLAFGIVNLRIRVERDLAVEGRQHYVERLRESLEDALQAIATTVEMRDPYTAGHQNRVAELSKILAKELGLSDDEIHGIYLAAIVHDLGKISVPAEILVKPSKLSEMEYLIVKNHVVDSYKILKGIKFPWPIADMVHQHHERLDGTGYPLGLKNGDILLGGRILAVADVMEAMSSHRPYRPGWGISAALEEVKKGRGTLFDATVVDACLKLFEEGLLKF